MTNSIDSAPMNELRRVSSSITAEDLSRHCRRGGAPRPWRFMFGNEPLPVGRPPRYERLERWRKSQTNPFTPMPPLPTRPSVLFQEAFRLYDATAFAMRKGVVFNVNITIVWRYLGVGSADHASELLTKFNHEAGKWLVRRLKPDTVRKLHNPRHWLPGTEHTYVAVHEWGDQNGFHTHELAFIPPAKLPAFRAWAEACLTRLAGRTYIPAPTLKITGGGLQSDERQLWRAWHWFRYITKATAPDAMTRLYGRMVPVRAIFKPRPFRDGASVDCAQRIAISHNIGPKAQRLAGFVSNIHRMSEIESLYDSSYLDEWRDEQLRARAEVEERARLEMLNNLDI